MEVTKMAERILLPDTKYYKGGTVPKTTGPGGLVEPDPLAAAQYAETYRVYKGGTISRKGTTNKESSLLDQDGRELFR
jgi:hypothetical protein